MAKQLLALQFFGLSGHLQNSWGTCFAVLTLWVSPNTSCNYSSPEIAWSYQFRTPLHTIGCGEVSCLLYLNHFVRQLT
jgi:hypothetical protein